jgi:NhaA family Na+:H+ antiporter
LVPPAHRATWLGSDRLLARALAQPINRFLHIEASGGLLLVGAAIVALVWANSPWDASYSSLWATEIGIDVGGHVLVEDLRHWVNDGLMALFFFVIGVEIKSELTTGDLRSPARAAIPVAGAIGGMVVPALLYLLVSGGGEVGHGWGIPMATDVAFALGVLALLGSRVPHELKVLLLALAIVDDIGAILVIAVFYTSSIELGWLAGAVIGLVAITGLRRAGVRYLPLYVGLGVLVWWMTFESGVHATIAGVVLGLMTPARPFLPDSDADAIAGELSGDTQVTAGEVRSISFRIRESVPMTERLQEALHPWTSYLIVPLFALANAGVKLSGTELPDLLTSRPTLAVIIGLVAGKAIGVTGAILLARRLGVGTLPPTLTARHIVGLGMVAGVGFTVSIFVAGLAFDDPALIESSKLGVLTGSILAAAAAAVVLRGTTPTSDHQEASA